MFGDKKYLRIKKWFRDKWKKEEKIFFEKKVAKNNKKVVDRVKGAVNMQMKSRLVLWGSSNG